MTEDPEEGKFIPNSFQTPNAYVDDFMDLLTPEEWKVLSYAIRRIFGFQKRTDRISLSQFIHGQKSRKTGLPLNRGTGLSKTAVINSLEALKGFKLVIETSPADPARNMAPEYGLQLDYSQVDIKGLLGRLEARREEAKKRTRKARKVKAEVLAQEAEETDPVCPTDKVDPVCPTDQTLSVPQTGPCLSDRPDPVCPTDTQYTLETNPETNPENQIQPSLTADLWGAGREVKNPRALKALQGWEAKQAGKALEDIELESKLEAFPLDVQNVISRLVDLWGLEAIVPSPQKSGGGKFAEWIAEARTLIAVCKGEEACLNALDSYAQDYWKETINRQGNSPFTVARPASIKAQLAQKAKALSLMKGKAPSPQDAQLAVDIVAANAGQTLEI